MLVHIQCRQHQKKMCLNKLWILACRKSQNSGSFQCYDIMLNKPQMDGPCFCCSESLSQYIPTLWFTYSRSRYVHYGLLLHSNVHWVQRRTMEGFWRLPYCDMCTRSLGQCVMRCHREKVQFMSVMEPSLSLPGNSINI